jgi:serine/threonine-protein kinase
MPNLFNKTVRDAEISLSRLGYKISNIEKLTSDEPINTILEQSPDAGSKLEKNSKISVKVSTGPSLAKVRVPDLYGLSLREATIILESNSLVVGNIKYESSGDLLPNTVITQLPSKNNLVSVGESVDLFVTKN